MKFDHLINQNTRKNFLWKSCRKFTWRLAPVKKVDIRLKQVASILVLIYFGRPWLGDKIKRNFKHFTLLTKRYALDFL